MTKREPIQQDRDSQGQKHRSDDRRSEVKPTDNPVPRSPEAEPESVRQGLDKLERVKAY